MRQGVRTVYRGAIALSKTLSVRLPDDHPIWSVPGKDRREVVSRALDWYFSSYKIIEEIKREVKEEIESLRNELKIQNAGGREMPADESKRKRLKRDKWLDF